MWQYHSSFPRKYYISTNLILQWNDISNETDICNDLEKLNRSYIISKTRIEFLETPVEWQSIRLIKSVVLFSSETISFSPSMFVFLTCTYWGCWSRQVENHRWPLLIQHCCYMLFIPLHRTKSTLKFFSRVGPLKRKKPALMICRQKFT